MQPQFKTNWFGGFLLVVPLLGLSLLAADLTIPLDVGAFLGAAFSYSAAAFLVFWILSTFRSKLSGTYVMVGLFFFIFWIFAGILAVAFVNQRLDSSKAETYTVPVLRKFANRGMWTGPVGGARTFSPPTRYAVVASWKSREDETIPVSAALYANIEAQKSRLEVTLRRGRLNLAWLQGVKIVEP